MIDTLDMPPLAPSETSLPVNVDAYREFVRKKVAVAKSAGFDIDPAEINPLLKDHQKAIVRWTVKGGRRAIFASFGLGKTVTALEIVRLVTKHAGGLGLIILPLGVRQEFTRDAEFLATGDRPSITDAQRAALADWQALPGNHAPTVKFIRTTAEITDADTLYLTNYESVRERKLNVTRFSCVSLDEAAALRGMGGTKTFREFMTTLAGDDRAVIGPASGGIKYRFVATATPAPNDFEELLAYSAYLGIQDVSASKTRFFQRDSTHADNLTIRPGKWKEFWLWVASWAILVQKPSDLGPEFSDEGYSLPELRLHFHEVPASAVQLQDQERDGQLRLLRDAAVGLREAAREKRESLSNRIEKMRELLDADPESHYLLWHDLEAERHAIQSAVPTAVSVWGSQDLEEREQRVIDFSEGRCQYLSSKPVLLGSGCNFQYYCHKAIFLGVGYKFNDWIQAIHRIHRFLQGNAVDIHIIFSEAERAILKVLLEKYEQHKTLTAELTQIVREYGLGHANIGDEMTRAMGVERRERSGRGWTLINADCVEAAQGMPENSAGLMLTSIPFSNQYEYSPNFMDFGHSDSNQHFWQQMEFLIPEIYRVLQPGRIAAIHVKDRITPGGINGLGFQTAYPLHADTITHFTTCPDCRKRQVLEENAPPCTHRFGYLGMRTIVTDVVRENNQTYRLGWTEQCKDGSKMGCGMPEYLLLFRKPPSDRADSYADVPILKHKADYSKSRWQIDAHAYWRSNGDRPLQAEDLIGLNYPDMFRLFRKHSYTTVYSHADHVRLAEALETCRVCGHRHIGRRSCAQGDCTCTSHEARLPTSFMLFQPQSWMEEVWSDITRMRTLNASQYAKGKEMHLCPMQLDIADRVINQMSNPGDLVWDPFMGLGTVAQRAILLGRRAIGTELNTAYWLDSVSYLERAEQDLRTPRLFDLLEEDEDDAETDVPEGIDAPEVDEPEPTEAELQSLATAAGALLTAFNEEDIDPGALAEADAIDAVYNALTEPKAPSLGAAVVQLLSGDLLSRLQDDDTEPDAPTEAFNAAAEIEAETPITVGSLLPLPLDDTFDTSEGYVPDPIDLATLPFDDPFVDEPEAEPVTGCQALPDEEWIADTAKAEEMEL